MKAGNPINFFAPAAIESIANYSNGSIRKLNNILTKCLIVGSSTQTQTITPDIVLIAQNDIEIKDNVLTFKNPLTVKVDSQKEGGLEILSSSSGIVDKTVDVVTSNKKAMEFLDEKSQNAIYKTSNNVMAQEKYQKKVAKYASQDLEKLLNLKSDDKISVKINVSDLKFENIDPKE